MALKGSNKKDYQKDYMRKKRAGLTGGVTLSDGQMWYPKQVKTNTGLPDHILKGISLAVKTYECVKGQPTLNERIRKALVYQEHRKQLGVTG